MSVRPADSYRLMTELPEREDPSIAKHLEHCSEQDYVSPLLGLMAEAAGGKQSLQQQNAWVLRIYKQIIDRGIEDGLRRQIAGSSASSLIAVLNGLYSGRSYQPYCSIDYNTAYKIEQGTPPSDVSEFEGSADDDSLKELAGISCLEIDSIIRSGEYLSSERFAEELRNHNPVSFFLEAWEMPSTILWGKHLPRLREALLKEGLNRVFPEKGELYNAYLDLFPRVSRLFDLARERRIPLNMLPADDEDWFFDRSHSVADCNCAIL